VHAHGNRRRTARLATTSASLALIVVLIWTGVASAGFPQSIKTNVPAGGSAEITSSGLPTTAKQGTIEVHPLPGQLALFAELVDTFAGLPSPAARFLFCVLASASAKKFDDLSEDFTVRAPNLTVLFLKACINFVLQLELSSSANAPAFSATATTKPCWKTAREISIKVTHANGTYTLHAHGTTHKPTHKNPAQVSCVVKNHGTFFTLKSAVKGKTLRKVVGPKLSIGFVNRGSKPVTVKTTFAVK
jgi:hypothetical protein